MTPPGAALPKTPANRRQFLRSAGVLIAASALPCPALAQAKPKVVVVGGGPGGATAAKYIARDSNGAIEVTLVEPDYQFVTCFHSNLYLGGFRSLQSITHNYDGLAKYGVKLVHRLAAAIDKEKRLVYLGLGGPLAYDRLVVAPGIDLNYDSVPGYSVNAAEIMPHAWKAGSQTQLLKKQLDALEDGALIVMLPPPNPYRCPPGPYERTSMMAHVLKAKGHRKSRIIIIDAKDSFTKQALFEEGWQKYYPGMIEWQDPKMHGGVKNVDAGTKTVATDLADYQAQLVNVIPAQMAGKIAQMAGLTNQSGFCPINPDSMKSAIDGNIYVVGDACISGEMPKAAVSANSQAKVAAAMIRSELLGAAAGPARYAVSCWSTIETDDAVKVGGSYAPKDGRIVALETFISRTDETADQRKQSQKDNMDWYANITADIFA
jgi:sulfide dehydrogenase [flavocytochrome c] flavoprotein subunit